MDQLKNLFFSILLLSLSGCAANIKTQDLEEIKTVGIINEFLVIANYTTVGTTIFGNKYDQIYGEGYKEHLTQTVVGHLENKGYTVKEVTDPDDASVDAVLYIRPNSIYGMADTNGYGFHKKTFFGKAVGNFAYVSMNVVPYVGGESRCSGCYAKSLTKLPHIMPEKWNDLEESQQAEFTALLKKDIEIAVEKALKQTKL